MATLLFADDRQSLMDSLSNALDSGADCFMLIPCTAESIAQQVQVLPEAVRLASDPQAATVGLLRMFKIPAHLDGYRQLCFAIPLFARDTSQCLSKEVYPAVAEALGYSDWRAVEHSIRNVILTAWNRRDPNLWAAYFPAGKRPPSNKRFLCTLAELLK